MFDEFTFLTIDFESYFDKDYTLKKPAWSNLEYIRSPKFKAQGAAIKKGNGLSFWVPGDRLEMCFERITWERTAVISHNSLFDLGILHDRFRISPGYRIDTLGLCRALLSHDLPFDLDTICPLLGGPSKLDGGDPLQETKGIYDLPEELMERLGRYACRDADMAWYLFEALWPELPDDQRDFMNLILRMSTEGLLRFDGQEAEKARKEITDDREAKLEAAGVDATTLRSRDKFAKLLQDHGVEPPTKTTYTKKHPQGTQTWAMSKTQDPAFIALQAHPDVGKFVTARFAVSSNNAITRIDRLNAITAQPPHTLPVQVKYYGAHTGRLAGAGSINMQNLNARGVGSGLRKAITAPPGHVIVVKDQSGIELRLNMWFSGQYDVLELIRQGGDVYIQQAANQYKVPQWERDKTDKKTESMRDYGKVVELGCGYQMGAPKFKANAATGPMGTEPRYLTDGEAYDTIQTYRSSRPYVKASWNDLNYVALPTMTDPKANMPRGPVTFKHERIELPNGMSIRMPNLEAIEDGFRWGMNGVQHHPYGGIMQENIMQSLTGIILSDNMLAIDKQLGGNDFARTLNNRRDIEQAVSSRGAVVHQVHDEILAVCRERDAEDVSTLMDEIMTNTPDWATGLPLEVEGGYAYEYSK